MPEYVPRLAKVDSCHLFVLDLVACNLFLFWNVLVKLQDGAEVHEVACIHGCIDSKLLVGAKITSSLFTAILDIVDHKASIVDDFSQPAAIVNVFVLFKVLQVISTQAASHDQSEDWSPSLTASIKQVVDRLVQSFVYSVCICLFECCRPCYFTSSAAVCQCAGILLFEHLPICYLSWKNLFHDLTVFEELTVLLQVWNLVFLFR